MKILFLAEGKTIPASRFRIEQFLPHFRSVGIDCTYKFGYGIEYNRWNKTAWGKPYKLFGRLKRAATTIVEADDYDIVFHQRTALPFSAWPEQLAAAHTTTKMIFDVDDAIFLLSSGEVAKQRLNAFRGIASSADHIIVGNNYLRDFAAFENKTSIIPTVIDTDVYKPTTKHLTNDVVVLGWMGTSSNFRHIDDILEGLLEALKLPNVRMRIVSNDVYQPLTGIPNVEQIPWTADTELALLRSFDIGIMPLLDETVSLGKCGFKLIQYMAVGVPVVSSSVGANKDIVTKDVGFMADSPAAWVKGIRTLANSAGLRGSMGTKAKKRAVEHYSIDAVVGDYLQIFDDLMEER